MKTDYMAALPSVSTPALTSYSSKSRRQRGGVVKLLQQPTPPDEITVEKLNALAAQLPFCRLHKVKKHDTL